MRIINALNEVYQYFENQAVSLEVWARYADSISPAMAQMCIDDVKKYDFNSDILPVVSQTLADPGRLKRLSDTFDAVICRMQDRVGVLFETDPDVTIILYLGLCNGAGWATMLNASDAVLLGAEKIVELDWDSEEKLKALIYHEIGHIWHKYAGAVFTCALLPRERALLQLYREGLAMVCEQILCGDDLYYHQGANWAMWCRENLSLIKCEYHRRMEQGMSVQDFFGDWNHFEGHSDTGYYLGCQFVRYLTQKYSLKEIAALPYEVLDEVFRVYACQE